MQKNLKNQPLEMIIISNPEAALEQERFTYQSAEIEEIIQSFNQAQTFRDVHRIVVDLLQATANFRYASVPNGLFFELRNKKRSDDELKAIFTKVEKALQQAQAKLNSFSAADQKIITNAINYIKKSIAERMQSLRQEDRLLLFWGDCGLKNLLAL